MIKFRDLTADEIEVRISRVTAKSLSLLLYKNARCDMNILDETVGSEYWQRNHELINGNLFCNVGIKFGVDEWVWKQDVGVESYTEKEKGQASDSFKRACFNWGIGRELYTAPDITIFSGNYNNKDGKCYDNFSVSEIEIVNKRITKLVIRNDTLDKVVFTWSENAPKEKKKTVSEKSDKLICKHCGKEIAATEKMSAQEVADYTKSKTGELLCAECMKERVKHNAQ